VVDRLPPLCHGAPPLPLAPAPLGTIAANGAAGIDPAQRGFVSPAARRGWQARRSAPVWPLPELLRQRAAAAGQKPDVGAHRHEQVAPADVAADFVFVAAEDAGRLVQPLQPLGRIPD